MACYAELCPMKTPILEQQHRALLPCNQSGARRARNDPSHSSMAQLQKCHPLPHWLALCLYTFSGFTLTFHTTAVTSTVLWFSITHPLDSTLIILQPFETTLSYPHCVCENTTFIYFSLFCFQDLLRSSPHIPFLPQREPIYPFFHGTVQCWCIPFAKINDLHNLK